MKKARDIHRILENVDLTVNADADKKVLERVLGAGRESTASVSQRNARRILTQAGLWRLAAAAVVIVAIGAGIYSAFNRQLNPKPSTSVITSPATGPTEDVVGQEIVKLSEPKDSVGRTGDMDGQESRTTATMGELSLAQRVARSSAIVRATLEEVTDECSRWRVKRVLFGAVDRATVDLLHFPVGVGADSMQNWKRALEDAVGRNLTTEEIWEEFRRIHPGWPTLGKEIILFLQERGQGYSYQGAAYDVPALNSLDDFEQRLLGVIESGEYKSESGGVIPQL
ncbi:MAG: hypothetical protein JSU94_02230 [Phycisphaerales bacterium]|nr:MAG: hypothetical protein JSU94_02230 [Phycisphaerales bacterium]